MSITGAHGHTAPHTPSAGNPAGTCAQGSGPECPSHVLTAQRDPLPPPTTAPREAGPTGALVPRAGKVLARKGKKEPTLPTISALVCHLRLF